MELALFITITLLGIVSILYWRKTRSSNELQLNYNNLKNIHKKRLRKVENLEEEKDGLEEALIRLEDNNNRLKADLAKFKKPFTLKMLSTDLVTGDNVGDLQVTYKDKDGKNKSLINGTMSIKVQKGLLSGAWIMRGGARVPLVIKVRK